MHNRYTDNTRESFTSGSAGTFKENKKPKKDKSIK
jgi:hypothetical protein